MTRHHRMFALALCAMPLTARAQTTVSPLLACFVPKSGTMYVVGQPGAPDKCRATDHVLLQWNALGPAGPTGAAGAPGPVGPQGPAGTATLVGSTTLAALEYVVAEQRISSDPVSTSMIYLTATCPAGKVAIGGGLLVGGKDVTVVSGVSLPYLQVAGGYPNAAFGYSNREWVTQALPLYGATNHPVRTVAICAKVN